MKARSHALEFRMPPLTASLDKKLRRNVGAEITAAPPAPLRQ